MNESKVREMTLEYFGGNALAADVFFKYALRDNKGKYLEATPDDMHRNRLAPEFARIEGKYLNALSEDKIYNKIKNFSKIVPQGSPMYGIGNDYKLVSLSNCVVVDPPNDTMTSILEQGKSLANLMKRRCGVGIDISTLRPEGAPVNNAARTSSGAWTFADFFSYVTRMVGQSGRRGALMVTMDVRHPDIEKFATMKLDDTKVTGANVSIKITDEFMEAVNKKEKYLLKFPVDSDNPTHTKEVDAKELWDLIVKAARDVAEPGLMMWDNIIKTLPAHCYPYFQTTTTNPCGEIPLSPGDSCRLISVNLYEHVNNKFKEDCYFDFEEFRDSVRTAQRMADDLVDLEIEKLTQIMEECDTEAEAELFAKLLEAARRGRRTGLGTHGLADCLAALRMRYDSDEAVEMVGEIYEAFKIAAYTESVNLAKERGAFPDFDWELEKDCEFFDTFPAELLDAMREHGRRNISLLTCAPTGSVSIESQVSSGVEPIFRLFYTRRKKINHNEDVEPDFVDKLGDKWKEYRVYHKSVKDAMEILGTEEIPDWFIESDDIDWIKRVSIQSAMQQHIDHSISSTINLPEDVKAEEVGKIYFEGWRQGLKGLTVYREGSRSGVLVSDDASENGFVARDAAKRPEEIPCDIHHVRVKGDKWVIIVGLLDGRPYEVFGGRAEKIELDKSLNSGILTKKKFSTVPNRYSLDAGVVKINDIIKAFDNPDNGTMTRMLSLALRHGTRPNYIVEQIQKDNNESFASFSKVVARVLKTYIEDGEKASVVNRNCETQENCNFVYQEGCATCLQCGWAKCG